METSETNIAMRCRKALREALASYSPSATFDRHGYVLQLRHNFLPSVALDEIRGDFEAGAGHELDTKMRAPHSSSVLAANTFGRWRRNTTTLKIADESDFETLKFEAQCSTGLGGTPPHLDVLAVSRDSVVAVESKCLEFLGFKRAAFSKSYDKISDERASSPVFKLIPRLRENAEEFRRLDVAQLVKHYLGLKKCWSHKRITLLYAYWEPRNAKSFPAFGEHRTEVSRFCELVRGDSTFSFKAVCHRGLWAEWESKPTAAWVKDHVFELRRRYDVLV